MESSGCQQYNLKWTNYMNNILQVFSEHLTQQSLVDVTLFCEGQVIKAHKIVLSASSTYFKVGRVKVFLMGLINFFC